MYGGYDYEWVFFFLFGDVVQCLELLFYGVGIWVELFVWECFLCGEGEDVGVGQVCFYGQCECFGVVFGWDDCEDCCGLFGGGVFVQQFCECGCIEFVDYFQVGVGLCLGEGVMKKRCFF